MKLSCARDRRPNNSFERDTHYAVLHSHPSSLALFAQRKKQKDSTMAKLGTEKRPVRFRVQTEERLQEITSLCNKNGWIFVGGFEPDEPEDLCEVEYLLNPQTFTSQPRMGNSNNMTVVYAKPKVGRNEPCPCGSGKKYKKCCMQ